MPIYEYACSQCQQKQEIIQKVSEPTPEACPSCQAQGTLSKMVTTGSFHLKGGGWYKDLYASPKKEATAPCATQSCATVDNKSTSCAASSKND